MCSFRCTNSKKLIFVFCRLFVLMVSVVDERDKNLFNFYVGGSNSSEVKDDPQGRPLKQMIILFFFFYHCTCGLGLCLNYVPLTIQIFYPKFPRLFCSARKNLRGIVVGFSTCESHGPLFESWTGQPTTELVILPFRASGR